MSEAPIKILLVDDERNIRKNLAMVLESAGYKVDATGNGEDAVTRCKERNYDIAFVDIQMPKMGGLELLRYIRALRPKMGVVMLTAYGTVSRAVEAMKLRAIDFLEKPFDPKNQAPPFEPTRETLKRLGHLDARPTAKGTNICRLSQYRTRRSAMVGRSRSKSPLHWVTAA